jgi:hypothetical protein
MVVSTPSGRMPRSNHSPLTPVPVPISTTARAPQAAANRRTAAPTPGLTAGTPISRAIPRAVRKTTSSGTYASANWNAGSVVPDGSATVAIGHLRQGEGGRALRA